MVSARSAAGTALTGTHCENSDVLLFESVAVAVTKRPTGTGVGNVA